MVCHIFPLNNVSSLNLMNEENSLSESFTASEPSGLERDQSETIELLDAIGLEWEGDKNSNVDISQARLECYQHNFPPGSSDDSRDSNSDARSLEHIL